METPNILIATPAHGANVKLQFVNSLLQTREAFDRRGVKYAFLGAANAEVVAARNFLASFMYERAQFTHLLFIDADMSFAPATVERLIGANKPLIGCICPRRQIDLATFAQLTAKGADVATATAGALEFVVRYAPETRNVEISNGLCSVLGVGMAVTLIHRAVFAGLLERGGIARYDRHAFGKEGLQGPMYGFFDPIRDGSGGHISEDFSFCERWVKTCGGETFALANEPVFHIGDFAYGGSYTDHLSARRV